MTLRQLLSTCIDTLALEIDLADADAPDVKLFVRLANFVFGEIATRKPLIDTVSVTSDTNGYVAYDAVSDRVHTVRGVSAQGVPVSYKLGVHGFTTDPLRTVTVEYAYLPGYCKLDSDVPDFGATVDERTLCYGINAEYCMVSGLYDESNLWRTRFDYAMTRAYDAPTRYVKARRLV